MAPALCAPLDREDSFERGGLRVQVRNCLTHHTLSCPGDIYKDPFLLLPGEAGQKDLSLLYDAIVPAIREVDSNTLIFYEPVTWGMVRCDQGPRAVTKNRFARRRPPL
jgi:hypothetical protein